MVAITKRRVHRHHKGSWDKEKLSVIGISCFAVLFIFWALHSSNDQEDIRTTSSMQHQHQDAVKIAPKLNVPSSQMESYLAIAQDIQETLDCHRLLAEIESKEDPSFYNMSDRVMIDDFNEGPDPVIPTAKHLFCLASLTDRERFDNATHVDYWMERTRCDATVSRQQKLLDLWSEAHSTMDEENLIKVLDLSRESEHDLVGTTLYLWAPDGDGGLAYSLSVANDKEKNVDYGGMYGLEKNLGEGKLFVDVGSCLGVSSMAVALLYPGTRIVSIEAASPNWLLQEMNWRCNNVGLGARPTIILSGVGGQRAAQMAKFLWRPSATTSTRSWTPKEEKTPTDLELKISLKSWHSILAQAEITHDDIDVLNCDCEGCEYNLIPSLDDSEFSAMKTVMGGIHWGYIPEHKLPSSERGGATHKRLCQHENFARTAKECCDFPNLPVISSIEGEILQEEGGAFPPKQSVVRDVAGDLCQNFDTWARDHHLHSITSDAGWFKLTSIAD